MTIKIIAAVDEELGIGKGNGIPWNHPEDMRYFKEKTLGSAVIMGYNTARSLPRLLSNRTNIVLCDHVTRRIDLSTQDPPLILCGSLVDAVRVAGGDCWIIGGSIVYEAAMVLASALYITRVPGTHGCDKFFPFIDEKVWRLEYINSPSGTELKFELWTKR